MMIKESVKVDKWFVIIVAVGAVLVGLYAWWFFANHHKVDYGVQYSPKSEVRQNRYHTAQKLIQQAGGDTHTFQSKGDLLELDRVFGDLASASDNVVMIYKLTEERESKLDEMMNWVSSGGHLVVFSEMVLPHDADKDDENNYTKNQNPLLNHVGIKYVRYNKQAQDGFDNAKMKMDKIATPLRMGDELVVVNGAEYYSKLGHFVADEFFNKYQATLINHDWRQKTKQGYDVSLAHTTLSAEHHATIKADLNQKDAWANGEPILFDPDNAIFDAQVGQGRLTVLSSSEMFLNPDVVRADHQKAQKPTTPNSDWELLIGTDSARIHNYAGGILLKEHGEFLLKLVADRTVYFVPDVRSEGFLELLRRYLPYAMIGLLMTIGATLLALPRQFGAVQTYETDTGRNIMGFFAQVGRYLWATDAGEGLLTQNRQMLLRLICAKEHISDKDNLVAILSQKTGLSAGLIHDALYADWQSEQEFLRISQSFKVLANYVENTSKK